MEKKVYVDEISGITALSTGSLHAFALAAAVQSSRPAQNTEDDKSFGLGVSGAVGINTIDTQTEAIVVGLDDSHHENPLGNLNVESLDDTYMFSLVGAAAVLAAGDGAKAGLAGSFGLNTLSGHTTADIHRSILNREEITVSATRSGKIRSITAGGSGARAGSGFSGAVAGAVSINQIDHDITSTISDTSLSVLNDLKVDADDTSHIYADAGGVALLLSTGGSGGLSFGMSLVKNDIRTDINATIDNTTITYSDNILVSAASHAIIEGVSIAGAGTVVSQSGTPDIKMPSMPDILPKIPKIEILDKISKFSLTNYWAIGYLFGGSPCKAPSDDEISIQEASE
ncbi:MAG: hypothetical protein OMM_13433, partial [Candidatus Magnetoglobus multicellularis str. Araruama]